MEITAGTVIGGYRILNLLGQGGMGVVYLAENASNGQRVALKLLTPDLARSSGFRERFVREANYASSMRHPNVIEVYDAGEQEDVLFIAMQYIEGEDLKSLLTRERQLDARRVVGILGQVASALDAAHATGLMHRDIKPGNVMIAARSPEHCYLTDFGLSKNPSADSIALTAQGEFVGTIDYTAPELVLGKQADHRLDVYSLGCLFYECLAGVPPFPKERDVEVLYAHIQDPPPRISAVRPDLPPALDDVIVKAMAKKPEDRYSTCSAFIDAARAIVGDPPAAAPPPPPPPPSAAPEAATPSPSAVPPPPPPPPGPAPVEQPPPPVAASADAPTNAPPVTSEPAALPDSLSLRVTAGPASGTVLSVGSEEFLIGRQAPGEGKLGNDIEISRRHARVTRGADGFVIEDLGSTNGTFVNGQKVEGARVLRPGDQLEMGDTKLVVEAPPEPEEDRVIAPTGAPPAVTTFAAIPADLPPVGGEPEAEAEASAEAEAPAEPEAAAPRAPEPPLVEAPPAPEPEPAEPEAVAEAESITGEPEVGAAEPEVSAPPAEAPPVQPPTEQMPPAELEPEAEAPSAVAAEFEAAPEPEPEPEPSAPPRPILVASSGPITVRIEEAADGELTLHLDDGEAPARFVRRGGSWSVE